MRAVKGAEENPKSREINGGNKNILNGLLGERLTKRGIDARGLL